MVGSVRSHQFRCSLQQWSVILGSAAGVRCYGCSGCYLTDMFHPAVLRRAFVAQPAPPLLPADNHKKFDIYLTIPFEVCGYYWLFDNNVFHTCRHADWKKSYTAEAAAEHPGRLLQSRRVCLIINPLYLAMIFKKQNWTLFSTPS